MISMPRDFRSWSNDSMVVDAFAGSAASASGGNTKQRASAILLASRRVTRKAYPYLAFR